MKRQISIILVTAFSLSIQCGAEIADKKRKYLGDAIEERVIFYAREDTLSDKKIARKGILYRRPNAKATVLICHGFTCDKYDVSFLHMLFKDYNSFSFDFRAHGEDREKQQSTLGRNEAYDVAAAADFIKNHPDLGDKPLIVYGFSMGAVASILAEASNDIFDALILDCPYDSTDKLLERGIQQMKLSVWGYEMTVPGASLLKSYVYNPYLQAVIKSILKTFAGMDATAIPTTFYPTYPEEAIKYITKPCFFISCVNDDKATEEAVMTVYSGAAGFKRLWVTPGRRHFDSIFYKMHEYFTRVPKFIEKVLSQEYKTKKQAKIKREIVIPYAIPESQG